MARMTLADEAVGRLGLMQASPGMARAAELLRAYAWQDRTTRTRNSQWDCWVTFCEAEDRPLLPVTEAHMISYIGWLMQEREAGRRAVGHSSLPQYLSAVRQMQRTVTGDSMPDFPLVSHLLRAYGRWEEEKYPRRAVRCGIPASVVQQIWGLGMSTDDPNVLRDAAVCVFAYCMNGLRESSVLTVEEANVTLTPDAMTVRLSRWKGKNASQLPLVSFQRLGSFPSPLDLWTRWHHARHSQTRYFALRGDSQGVAEGYMTAALLRCLRVLGISPPEGGTFTSHSLRIGSHTEQVLMGIPLEVRLARFGWGPRSEEMAALYFDRTMRLSTASFWIFGMSAPSLPLQQPAATELS